MTPNALAFDHSTFLIEGSNHSYHLALHCLGVFRTKSDEIRAHCCETQLVNFVPIDWWIDVRLILTFLPYFEMAALRISSSVFLQTPPLTMTRCYALFSFRLCNKTQCTPTIMK